MARIVIVVEIIALLAGARPGSTTARRPRTERHTPKGWRCMSCHPPVHLAGEGGDRRRFVLMTARSIPRRHGAAMALIRYRPAPGPSTSRSRVHVVWITCDRCGKDRMLNETHTPQGGMHRAGWILLTGIVAGTCGTTATARAAKIYGNWVESADNTECVLFTVPQDSGPIIMLRARNKIKVISVAAKSGHDLQAGRLIITVDQRQVVTLDLIGRGEPMALLPFELSEAMRDGRVIDIEWSEKGHEPVTASYPISRDGFDAWDACAKWQSEAR